MLYLYILACVSTATEVTETTTTTKLSILQVLFYALHLTFKLLRQFTGPAREKLIF